MAAEVTTPGLYDLPEQDYFADPVPEGSLSQSGAKTLLRKSPAHYAWEREHGRPNKREFDFGHAAHAEVLGVGAEVAVIEADDFRTKDSREQRDAAYGEGKTPILAKDYAKVLAMADAIRAHPIAPQLLNPGNGKPEQSAFWRDERTGIWCRARYDWLPEAAGGRLLLPDFKTSPSADPREFGRKAFDFGYACQAAWYSDGLRQLGYADEVAFLFVVQEREAPYSVSIIELDRPALRVGEMEMRRAREVYARCVETGTWPDYGDDVHLVSLPSWAETRTLERYG